jgi:CBS-domain-containing membrane protein
MKASDIMTSPVVTVEPDTEVRTIAELLVKHRISGVPVVDDGRLVGIVSEGDLLRRREIGTDRKAPKGSWWLRLFSADSSPADYVKSHARYARDIMTPDVVSVSPNTSLSKIATLLEQHGIKRVTVLSEGKLVGIVSRANLVQAIAVLPSSSTRITPPLDSAIRGRLLTELERQSWWGRTSSNVIVCDGVVHYWGMAGSGDERAAARVAAQNVPGVRAVEDHRLTYTELPYAV